MVSPRSFPGGFVGEHYQLNPRLRKRLVSPDNWKRDQGHTHWLKSIVRRHEDLKARELKQDHLGEQRVSKMIENIQQAEAKRQQREKENLLLREKRMAETAARLEDLKKQMNKRLSDKQKQLKLRLRSSIQAVTGGMNMLRRASFRNGRPNAEGGSKGSPLSMVDKTKASQLNLAMLAGETPARSMASTPEPPSDDELASSQHQKPDTPDETDTYGSLLGGQHRGKPPEVKQFRRRVSTLSGPPQSSRVPNRGDGRRSSVARAEGGDSDDGPPMHQQVAQGVETLECWQDALPWLEPPEMPARSELLKEEVEAVWEKPGVFKNRMIKLEHTDHL